MSEHDKLIEVRGKWNVKKRELEAQVKKQEENLLILKEQIENQRPRIEGCDRICLYCDIVSMQNQGRSGGYELGHEHTFVYKCVICGDTGNYLDN